MYNVILQGFKTKEQAEEFVKWYGESGEQYFGDWLDCQDKEINMTFAPVNYNKPPLWDQNNFEVNLEILDEDE